jgi:hypothetical protein
LLYAAFVARASMNSCFESINPCLSIGRADNQDEAPLSDVSSTSLFWSADNCATTDLRKAFCLVRDHL